MDVQNRKVGGLEAASTDDVGNRVGAGVLFLTELRDSCSSDAKRRRDDLGTEARQPLKFRQYGVHTEALTNPCFLSCSGIRARWQITFSSDGLIQHQIRVQV